MAWPLGFGHACGGSMAQGNVTLMGERMMREAVLHIGTMCLARGRCNATCGLRIVMAHNGLDGKMPHGLPRGLHHGCAEVDLATGQVAHNDSICVRSLLGKSGA